MDLTDSAPCHPPDQKIDSRGQQANSLHPDTPLLILPPRRWPDRGQQGAAARPPSKQAHTPWQQIPLDGCGLLWCCPPPLPIALITRGQPLPAPAGSPLFVLPCLSGHQIAVHQHCPLPEHNHPVLLKPHCLYDYRNHSHIP